MAIIETFESLLARGQDTALLRYSLGNEYSKAGQFDKAVTHLKSAVQLDPGYSAAWKGLGKALAECGDPGQAIEVYASGIAAAEQKGDKQAAKEMQVFKRRLEKAQAGG